MTPITTLSCGGIERLPQEDREGHHHSRADARILDIGAAVEAVDQLAGHPKSETLALWRGRRCRGASVEQSGHVLGKPRPLIGDRDAQRCVGTPRGDDHEPSGRRGRARVQQKIESDLADGGSVDRERLEDAVLPVETEPTGAGLMLYEKGEIVEIALCQKVCVGAALVGYEGRAGDIANPGEPTLEELQ